MLNYIQYIAQDIALHINDLHKSAHGGSKTGEKLLFEHLSVSFRMFVRLRVTEEQDVEDIVQDTLMTIANKYRTIEFETSFAAWSYRVLENVLGRYYRSKKRRARVIAQGGESQSLPPAPEENPMLKSRLLECLKLISKTKLRHARILTLHFQGYSVKEICKRLGLSVNNLYVMLWRARAMLAECIEKGMSTHE
ncbi:MAG: sigma-70 family RNA polymerase sigma factor [Candidatus Zixiibacteriota bacterium]|nr:MAG: sigma-70 family RNA polymerase sigma factor [candidate division Zixibacteria bacterium]